MGDTFAIYTTLVECFDDCQQLLVMNIVIQLCSVEFLRIISQRVKHICIIWLGTDCPDGIV
jgi:ABC-type siderophore export system fused ATPase/permease subunit